MSSFLIVLYILQNGNQGAEWIYLIVCSVRLYKFCMSLPRTELAISDCVWVFSFTLL